MTTPTVNQQITVEETLGISRKPSLLSRIVRLFLWCAFLGLAGYGAYLWLNRDYANRTSYETALVEQGNIIITVSATGSLAPIKTVDVGIEVSGTVMTVEVNYNDRVTVGQVLAQIDTSKLEAQMLQSEAALESTRAKLLQTQATVQEAELQMARLEEVRKLSDGKLPSVYDFDAQKAALARAKADEAGARAAVSQAQATVDVNRSDLEKAVVHSPVDGIVLERLVEPGQTVAAMFQSPVLFILAEDLTQMELQADVDEADIGQVTEGQDAVFTVAAYPEKTFPAKITQVRFGSETVSGVVTYKTILSVDNSDLSLRPGMTATAQITVNRREDVVLAPNAALRFTPPQAEAKEETGGGILLSKILPRPPRSESTQRTNVNASSREQQVWTLKNGQLIPITITKGLSDGIMTEVTDGEVAPGMALVADITAAP